MDAWQQQVFDSSSILEGQMLLRGLQKRWGRSVLKREAPAARMRQGKRLDGRHSVLFLAPAHNASLRKELKDLLEGIEGHPDLGVWSVVVDTGLTRKAHAKSRAQRIRSLESGMTPPPDFPQHSSVHLFWRDEVGRNGLPKGTPDWMNKADVLVLLGRSGDNLVLSSLLKRSTVSFKVGPTETDCEDLDFMLAWPKDEDMSSFVQLALHYLKTLDLK